MSISVTSLEKAAAFYDNALAGLGYRRVCEFPNFIGYGMEDGKDKFAICQIDTPFQLPAKGMHIALAAPNRANVDAFHANAITSGGICNGPPGLRANYSPDYYAAFVIDPDGYHIEAVHKSQ